MFPSIGKSKCRIIPTLLLLLSVVLYGRHAHSKLCCEDFLIDTDDYRVCKNGHQNISLDCGIYPTKILNPFKNRHEKFEVDENTNQLTAAFFTVTNTSEYCLASYETADGMLHKVAIVCTGWFNDYDPENVVYFINYDMLVLLLSSCCLLLTAIVYYIVPQLKDLQGICIFHLSLLMAANYFFMVFPGGFDLTLSQHWCISHSYLSCYCLVSGFMWMHILSYNMWKTSKGCTFDKEHELTKYKILCYTAPLVLILIPLITLYFEDTTGYDVCHLHQRTLYSVYVSLPLVTTMIINVFYFVDTGRRLWEFYKQQSQPSRMKGLRYKCGLYIKLFLITGLPWLVLILASSVEGGYSMSYVIIEFIAHSQGVFVFIVMVLCRKRARRGLAAKKIMGRQIFPNKWMDMNDDEETQEEYQFDTAIPRPENNHQNHI